MKETELKDDSILTFFLHAYGHDQMRQTLYSVLHLILLCNAIFIFMCHCNIKCMSFVFPMSFLQKLTWVNGWAVFFCCQWFLGVLLWWNSCWNSDSLFHHMGITRCWWAESCFSPLWTGISSMEEQNITYPGLSVWHNMSSREAGESSAVWL